jgi:hypothetical protein
VDCSGENGDKTARRLLFVHFIGVLGHQPNRT